MKLVKGTIETGFVNCDHFFEFEVEDDTSEEVIQELVEEEVWNCINVYWDIEDV